MAMRVLDDRARFDRKLRDALPNGGPDTTPWLNLLGEVFSERHERAADDQWVGSGLPAAGGGPGVGSA